MGQERDPKGDPVLLAYYNSARAELVQRIQQRDQAVAVFGGVMGVLVTAVLAKFESRYVILFAVPYVGLGATFVSVQHDALINLLERYCRDELAVRLHDLTCAPQWNESRNHSVASEFVHRDRLLAHICLLVLPQVLAWLAGTYGLIADADPIGAVGPIPIVVMAAGGAAPVIYSTQLIWQAYRRRKESAE